MSPRTNKQFEEIREQSRDKIMMAALELFATRGFHNSSISKIAAEAKVAKGLIYNYFDSKEDLLHAIINQALEEGDQFIHEMQNIEDPKEQLRYVFNLAFGMMVDKFHYSKLLTSLSLQLDQFPGIMKTIHDRYKSTIPLLEHLLQKLGIENHQAEAKALAAMMDGIGIQYIVLYQDYPLEEMKQYLMNKYDL